MHRGPVIHRVVLVPMQICTQQEGDKTIAVMPGWTLPRKMAECDDELSAIASLCNMMLDYWGVKKK